MGIEDKTENLKRFQRLINFLHLLEVLSFDQYIEAHRVKWGHKYIGKPEWVK